MLQRVGLGRGRLLYRYVALLVSVTGAVLLLNGMINMWMSYDTQKTAMLRLQQEQARAGAARISAYLRGIETHLRGIVQSSWSFSTNEDRQVDAIRLMNLVPAVHELAIIDPAGREQVRLSRLGPDAMASGVDRSAESAPAAGAASYGQVRFVQNSEPHVQLAVGSGRRDGGAVVADINLKLIWDVVAAIRIGERGRAYVVDRNGVVVAHPDISLVLRNTDASLLRQVRDALGQARPGDRPMVDGAVVTDLGGAAVLAAHARIDPVGWFMIAEVPAREAFAPAYASLRVTIAVLAGALVLAVLASVMLARTMVMPIRVLQAGAARIGAGGLDHRIAIASNDELAELGRQFNDMAARLQVSYATLEQKVADRTRELALANDAKSRFLAAASHDLRQPLSAINLFVAQLSSRADRDGQVVLVARIEAALANMNALFDALLDISRLDGGAIAPEVSDFPLAALFGQIETNFAGEAQAKGLRLRIVASSLWVRSDPILLERIVANLVSNAIRYTPSGGVVIGCRRDGDHLRILVCDSGVGIAEAQRANVFAEFYQVAGPSQLGQRGLGLGLSIVDRLARLLAHDVALRSREGAGSWFSVRVPIALPRHGDVPLAAPVASGFGEGMVALVVDDDPLSRDALTGMFEDWDFDVDEAASVPAALAAVERRGAAPALIVSDFNLGPGATGADLIVQLRRRAGRDIAALLVSGDGSAGIHAAVRDGGIPVLAKPVLPVTLRAAVSSLINRDPAPGAGIASRFS